MTHVGVSAGRNPPSRLPSVSLRSAADGLVSYVSVRHHQLLQGSVSTDIVIMRGVFFLCALVSDVLYA